MSRRLSLAAVLAGILAITAAYAVAFLPGDSPGWAAWALGVGTAAVMTGAMALGAAGRPGARTLAPVFAAVFVVLAGGFGWALALPPVRPGDPLVLGLPAGAAVVLLGIGLLPLLFLPLAYALTFERTTLSEADLDRVREAGRAFRAARETAEGAR